MYKQFSGLYYVGAAIRKADKDTRVFVFDLDSTLTYDPDRTIHYSSKAEYFDAARSFGPNMRMANYARYFNSRGFSVVIATARPPERLAESIEWLTSNDIPFDQIMLSTGEVPSSLAKQSMLKDLKSYYKSVECLYDDSIYNIKGAELQGVPGKLIATNCEYWRNNPEVVTPLCDPTSSLS